MLYFTPCIVNNNVLQTYMVEILSTLHKLCITTVSNCIPTVQCVFVWCTHTYTAYLFLYDKNLEKVKMLLVYITKVYPLFTVHP